MIRDLKELAYIITTNVHIIMIVLISILALGMADSAREGVEENSIANSKLSLQLSQTQLELEKLRRIMLTHDTHVGTVDGPSQKQ